MGVSVEARGARDVGAELLLRNLPIWFLERPSAHDAIDPFDRLRSPRALANEPSCSVQAHRDFLRRRIDIQ
jgi:hypothetical protein